MPDNQLSQAYQVALNCQREDPQRVVATFVPQGTPRQFIVASDDDGESLTWVDTSDDPGIVKEELENEFRVRIHLRSTWQQRVDQLLSSIKTWSEAEGWSTKSVPIFLESRFLGPHPTSMLYLQKDRCRLQVEPISPTPQGAEGLVDIYRLPALDDIASIYFYDGAWKIHHLLDDAAHVNNKHEAAAKPFDQRSLAEVLQSMVSHAD